MCRWVAILIGRRSAIKLLVDKQKMIRNFDLKIPRMWFLGNFGPREGTNFANFGRSLIESAID